MPGTYSKLWSVSYVESVYPIPGDTLPLRDDFPGIVLVCQFLVFIVASADRYWKGVPCTCGVGDTFLDP
jgi:hypothetical protein